MNQAIPIECQALFFDLDGTLVDSVPDIAIAVNMMLTQLKIANVRETVIRNWVGNGLGRLVQRSLAGEFDAPVEHPDLSVAVELCEHFYAKNLHCKTRCYGGVRESLETLLNQGFQLACITNKPEVLSKQLLRHLQLEQYFKLVLGGDTLPSRKPDAAPLQYAAEKFNRPISQCVMIGDSSSDILAAKATGCASICVSYGYNQGLDLRSLQPDLIIDQFPQILDHVIYNV